MSNKKKSVEAFKVQGSLIVDTSHSPDFAVIVGTETVLVHRDLLGAVSHYFHCLFESGMMEVQTATVEMNGVLAEVLKTVIAYMYGKAISIEWDDVMDYMDIIEMWQLLELKIKFEDYIIKNVDEYNCVKWYCMGNRYMMAKLAAKSKQLMISARFSVLFTSPYFPLVEFSVLQDILKNGKRKATEYSWCAKHDACMKWILQDETDRQCHYVDLLNILELTECPSGFLTVALKIYMNTFGKGFSLKPYKTMLSELPAQTKLVIKEDEDAMVVLTGDHYPHQPSRICIVRVQKKFIRITFLPALNLPSASGFRSKINNCYCYTPYGMFACGNWDRVDKDIMKCLLFDIPSLSYIHLPNFPVPVRKVRVICVNYKVYILYMDTSACRMRYLDLDNPIRWPRCAPRPKVPAMPFVCSIGAKIYCLDMTPCSRYVLALHCYDTRDGTWSKRQRPPDQSHSYSAHIPSIVATNVDVYVLYPHSHFLKYMSDYDCWLVAEYSEIDNSHLKDNYDIRDSSYFDCWTKLTNPVFRGYTLILPGCIVTYNHQDNQIELYTNKQNSKKMVKRKGKIENAEFMHCLQNVRAAMSLSLSYQF